MIEKPCDTAKIKNTIDIPSQRPARVDSSALFTSPCHGDGESYIAGEEVKRPSFQFYPEAWLADIALRAASSAARGLWMDMLCLMHQGTPYGHLRLRNSNGGFFEPNESELAKMTGNSAEEVKGWIAELDRIGVLGRKKSTIFSKKMVRDESQRAQWRKRQTKSRGIKDKDLDGNSVTPSVTPMSRRSSSPTPTPTPSPKEKRKKPPPPPPDIRFNREERKFEGTALDALNAHLVESYTDEFGQDWIARIAKKLIQWRVDNPKKIYVNEWTHVLNWYRRDAAEDRDKLEKPDPVMAEAMVGGRSDAQ